MATFGPKLKELRIRANVTLRNFCLKGGFDPGNYSRIERGLFAPPSDEKVREYAAALGLQVGSDEFVDLLDRAAIDRGQLPADILNDEQVLAELPVLFRSLRGDPVNEDDLNKLVDLLRKR